jgi:biotin synthase
MSSLSVDEILKNAVRDPITPNEAIILLKKITSYDKALELFKVATSVRGDEIDNKFKFDGFIGTITRCTTNPPCRYCGRSAKNRSDTFTEPLTLEEIETGAKLIAETGVKCVEIGGGTVWDGAGNKVIEAVKTVKSVAPELKIWVNVGPALSKDDLLKLKELGVIEVCSSLETFNPKVFTETKPGDSMEARKKLAKEIDEVGLGLTSVMMVGLGSSYEDYVNHIFWLKKFKNLSHFPITGFRPIPGTPMENHPMASPIEVAKVGAVARLVLRKVDLSFGGMMNDPRLLPLWIMAGANRAIHLGPHVHRLRQGSWFEIRYSQEVVVKNIGKLQFQNMLPLTTRIVKDMGMEVDVS